MMFSKFLCMMLVFFLALPAFAKDDLALKERREKENWERYKWLKEKREKEKRETEDEKVPNGGRWEGGRLQMKVCEKTPEGWKCRIIDPGSLENMDIPTGGQMPSVLDNFGESFTGKRGEKKSPNYVTADVEFTGEFATIDLNKYASRGRLDVSPTSNKDIKVMGITPMLSDTTKTPATYGWWINRELNQITIKSSNANDSSSVRLWMMVQ